MKLSIFGSLKMEAISCPQIFSKYHCFVNKRQNVVHKPFQNIRICILNSEFKIFLFQTLLFRNLRTYICIKICESSSLHSLHSIANLFSVAKSWKCTRVPMKFLRNHFIFLVRNKHCSTGSHHECFNITFGYFKFVPG